MTTTEHKCEFDFYPTLSQAEFLEKAYGCGRAVYNTVTGFYVNNGLVKSGAEILDDMLDSPDFVWLNDTIEDHLVAQAERAESDAKSALNKANKGGKKLSDFAHFRRKSGVQSLKIPDGSFSYENGELFVDGIGGPLDVKFGDVEPGVPSHVFIRKRPVREYSVIFA